MYSELRRGQLLARLFSNASVYGLGILATRALGILLLPVYWLKLSPADFGVIGLCQALMVFLAPVLSLGLNDAMQRFYYDWDPDTRPSHLAALWLSACAFGFVLCLLLELTGRWLFPVVFTQVSFEPLLRIALWSACAANVSLIPLTVLRVREQIRRFTLVTVAGFLLQAGLTVWFLFAMELGVTGFLLAALISNAVVALYAVSAMLPAIRVPTNLRGLREPLRYALPLVPTTVVEGLSTTMDRLVLDKFVGLTQIGLYSVGNQFGSAVNMFNQVLKSAWIPFVFRTVSERSDGPAILGKFSVYYIAALCVPGLAVALLSREFIVLFGGERFAGAYPFVPAFVLMYVIQASGTALGRGIDIARKTHWSLVVPLVSVVTGLIALSLLVPPFGVWGAIAAALVTTIVRTAVHVALAFHFYPRPTHWRALAVVTAVSLLAFLAGSRAATGHLALDVTLKLCIIGAAALGIFWFALDRRQGLELLHNLRRKR